MKHNNLLLMCFCVTGILFELAVSYVRTVSEFSSHSFISAVYVAILILCILLNDVFPQNLMFLSTIQLN